MSEVNALPHYKIVSLKRKIMAKFNAGNVNVDEVSHFVMKAEKSGCFAIAEEMQKRLDNHIRAKEAGIRSWEK
jgi:hypothetical protein